MTPTNKSSGIITGVDNQVVLGQTILAGVILLSDKVANAQCYIIDDLDSEGNLRVVQVYLDGAEDMRYFKLPDILMNVGMNVTVTGGGEAVVYYR